MMGYRAMKPWILVVLAVAACGDNRVEATVDADPGVDTTPDAPEFSEAPHGNVPQVVSLGGPVLANPVVVPIFFANDDTTQAQIEQMLNALHGSSYWHDIGAEYGVGDLTVAPTIVTTATVPTTDTELEAFIADQLDGTHTDFGTLDPNAIYSVFLPSGAVLQTDFGQSCQAFGAYHSETSNAVGKITYALMPRCQGGIDSLTVATSHELIEAATDPLPFTEGAFQDVDAEHAIWGFVPGAEVGDMCEFLSTAADATVGGFRVQRSWSNASAAAGHDPCVPALDDPYQGAAPLFVEDLPFGNSQGQPITTKGVSIPVNTTKTIDIALFSDAETEDFTVRAFDASLIFGGQPELTFAFDQPSGHNGDVLKLSITRTRQGQGGSEFLLVVGSQNQATSMWWGFVGN